MNQHHLPLVAWPPVAVPNCSELSMKTRRKIDLSSPGFLLLAALISLLLWFLPFAQPFSLILIYPFRLFVTFIHEGGHAVAAILTGGTVDRLVIHPDASGETYTIGGVSLLIASAGYLTSAAYGGLLLALSRQGRNSRNVLIVNAFLILALTGLFAEGIFTWIVGIALIFVLLVAGSSRNGEWPHLLLNFLALQCSMNAIFDLGTLLQVTSTTRIHNDAAIMENATLIPALIWALMWAALSLLFLVVGLLIYARNGDH